MKKIRPRCFRCLIAVILTLLAQAAAVGGQERRDPDAPGDLLQPPPDAERSPSGLISKVLQAGTGELHPDANDLIAAHFTGWSPDGVKFLSSHDRGQPAIFKLWALAEVFPGWVEGLQLMVVGEKRRLWIPAHLAHKNPAEGPRGAVVFDVELTGIRPIPNLPPGFEQPPADAEKTPSGALTRRLAEGEGEERPGSADVAVLHWTGWATDRQIFDSTAIRGRPTAFPLDKILAPFADAVRLMTIGEKRHIWIPGDLAAGQWPEAPEGMLIFEVQLMRIMDPSVLREGRETGTEDPGLR